MKLTEHFSLEEFTRSSTASAQGIDNSLNPENPKHAKIIANLKHLCENVLEPLRAYAGQPIIIGSGYRCPALNSHPEVRGATNSNHLYGYAADIHLPDTKTGREWFRWIMDNCQFHELIWETADRKRFWIHVAIKPKGNAQRVVSFLLKK